MMVWISEFTYRRLVVGLGYTIPVHLVDSHGKMRVDLAKEIVENAVASFGSDLDVALNQVINHNQKQGTWPKSPPFAD